MVSVGEERVQPVATDLCPEQQEQAGDQQGVAGEEERLRGQIVLGVRTIWANPDDVVAKLFAIPADQLLRDPAVRQARAIALAAPTSPFATDFRAGLGGGGALAPAIGIAAAVAIPAFLDYKKRAKPAD